MDEIDIAAKIKAVCALAPGSSSVLLNHDPASPSSRWHELAQQGLLGIGLPARCGGQGGDWVSVAQSAELLARYSFDVALPMLWLMQMLISRQYLAGFGNTPLCDDYLADIVAGKKRLALAVSEPGVGAHPKRLSTRAMNDSGSYILNGQKAWVTNATVADFFVVVAITGETNQRRQFAAFLVDKDNPGLAVGAASQPLLGSLGHAGLTLSDCRVPADAMLAAGDDAWDRMIKPFRRLEDVLFLVIGVGMIRRGLDQLLTAWRGAEQTPSEPLLLQLGQMYAQTDILSTDLCRAMECAEQPTQAKEFDLIMLARRGQFQALLSAFEHLAAAMGQKTGEASALLNRCRQMQMFYLRRNDDLAKRIGAELFERGLLGD